MRGPLDPQRRVLDHLPARAEREQALALQHPAHLHGAVPLDAERGQRRSVDPVEDVRLIEDRDNLVPQLRRRRRQVVRLDQPGPRQLERIRQLPVAGVSLAELLLDGLSGLMHK